MGIAAVLLAAGRGSRFVAGDGAASKLLAPLANKPVAAWAIDAALGASLDAVVVVTGATDLSAVLPHDVVVVHNAHWQNGQASSLHCGLRYCDEMGFDSAVIGLADMPGITASAYDAVAFAVGGPIVVATYEGTRGHPVRLDASIWPRIGHTGDQGARSIMRDYPELVTEVPCRGRPGDIDTADDLREWM